MLVACRFHWKGAGLEIQKSGYFVHHLENLGLRFAAACATKERIATGREKYGEEPQQHCDPKDYLIQINLTILFQVFDPI